MLTADSYFQGHLDWYNLDSADSRVPERQGRKDPQASPVQTTIPVPINYAGMPNTRWWAFEESRVNFGAVKPAITDIGKLMLLEFGLVYANDWFMIPVTLDAGSIAQVRAMAVTTVFGERFWIEAAGSGPSDDWQRWSMFTLSPSGGTGNDDATLLLLPVVPKVQEGPDVESVALVRDEIANMVWGVERTIPLGTGAGKPGREAALESAAYYQRLLDAHLAATPPPPAQPAAPLIYKVMNSVPENWIPFIPVHVPNDVRATQLQRAAMPRLMDGDPNLPEKIRPRTTLLRDGLDRTPSSAYFVHDEEVPRSGALVSLAYQRTRWNNGKVVTWLGARKQSGRGEGSSCLAFDRLLNAPPT